MTPGRLCASSGPWELLMSHVGPGLIVEIAIPDPTIEPGHQATDPAGLKQGIPPSHDQIIDQFCRISGWPWAWTDSTTSSTWTSTGALLH